MKTLGQRVEAYAGDFLSLSGSKHLASAFLTSAARHVCNIAPVSHLAIESVSVPSAGFPAMDIRISYAMVGQWRATMISPEFASRASNTDSKYGGTGISPVYYVEDNYIKFYPIASARIHGVKLHRYLDSGDFSVHNVSPEVEEIIVLDAARSALLHMMKLGANDLDAYTVQTFTAPTSIADPSFTFTPATAYLAEGRLSEILSLAEQYAELSTMLDTDHDIELSSAKVGEMQVRIAEFRANVEAAAAELQANAGRQTDVSIRNAVEELGRQVQEYSLKLRKFEAEVSLFLAKHNGQNQLIQALTEKAKAVVDEKTKRFTLINALFTQKLQLIGINIVPEQEPKQ